MFFDHKQRQVHGIISINNLYLLVILIYALIVKNYSDTVLKPKAYILVDN